MNENDAQPALPAGAEVDVVLVAISVIATKEIFTGARGLNTNFLLVPHRQNDDRLAIEAVASHIPAVAKVNRPLSVLFWHVRQGAPDLRLVPKHFQGFDDGLACAFGSGAVLGTRKSLLAYGRGHFVFSSPTGKPVINLSAGCVQAGFLIFLARLDRVLPKCLTPLLSVNILGNGFAHDPMRRTISGLGQTCNTGTGVHIEFDGHGFGRSDTRSIAVGDRAPVDHALIQTC